MKKWVIILGLILFLSLSVFSFLWWKSKRAFSYQDALFELERVDDSRTVNVTTTTGKQYFAVPHWLDVNSYGFEVKKNYLALMGDDKELLRFEIINGRCKSASIYWELDGDIMTMYKPESNGWSTVSGVYTGDRFDILNPIEGFVPNRTLKIKKKGSGRDLLHKLNGGE